VVFLPGGWAVACHTASHLSVTRTSVVGDPHSLWWADLEVC
jgi:hypothetical protein